jgi:uncharacterized membrane protein
MEYNSTVSPEPFFRAALSVQLMGSAAEGDERGPVVTWAREAFVTGLAVVVPGLVTVGVVFFILDAVYRYLDLVSDAVVGVGLGASVPVLGNETAVELVAPVLLLTFVFAVGLVVNATASGERLVDGVDAVITRVPGVGSVYDSFRQMSDVMLESDAQNFRDVKLVEFPHEGAYTIGFVTTRTPKTLAAPTGHDAMLTLFLPLAPNPVMGGHLVHLPEDRVMDVDMTVEEGIRAVVTSGVAVAGADASDPGLSADDLREMADAAAVDRRFDPDSSYVEGTADPGRVDRYDAQVDPDNAVTPGGIARRERDPDRGAATEERPAAAADRAEAARDETDERPAKAADRAESERAATEERPAAAADRAEAARDETDERPAEAADGGEDDR